MHTLGMMSPNNSYNFGRMTSSGQKSLALQIVPLLHVNVSVCTHLIDI